jgi:diadenosine tetraphosphatase ApaH/serine/threonine PP2A family protein phosphatase
MRYVLIADIHSNLEALESIIAFTRKLEPCTLLCLGDIVGYGADPAACLDEINNNANLILAGNHDLAVSGVIPTDDFNPIAEQAVQWTRKQLNKDDIELLSNMPLEYIDGDYCFTHGSPIEPLKFNYVTTLDDVAEVFSSIGQRFCFVGHTHLPIVVRMNIKSGKMEILRESKIKTSDKYRFFVNVGSVGQPRDSNPDACVMVFDEEIESLEFLRVPYDITLSQSKILSNGLPSYLAERLMLAR